MVDPAHRLTDLYSAAIDATDAQASDFSKPAVPLLSASDFSRQGGAVSNRFRDKSPV
jgi:hypothetical protein